MPNYKQDMRATKGNAPMKMESPKQERKDLMKDMPIDRTASGSRGGSWMSKHSQSRIGGSPAKMYDKSPAMMKDSPMEKELVGKQANLPEALKSKIEAAPESPAMMYGGKKGDDSKSKKDYESPAKMYGGKKGDDSKSKKDYM